MSESLVDLARKGQLAADDPRLATVQQHVKQGVASAARELQAIIDAGGWHTGSVNKVV